MPEQKTLLQLCYTLLCTCCRYGALAFLQSVWTTMLQSTAQQGHTSLCLDVMVKVETRYMLTLNLNFNVHKEPNL